MADEQTTTRQRARRRASRAAGPPKSASSDRETSTAAVEVKTVAEPKQPAKKTAKPLAAVRPPARRRARRGLVAGVSLAAAVLVIAPLSWGVLALVGQHRAAEAEQAREQRFVDTATQTVVNMFSYTPNTIDEAVNRFVNGTSGPLRGMLSANNNVDNLKGLFRATNATSEAVINGAALEGIDTVSDNASVLVSVRVTVADIDGVNKPSMPYRLRVIVHEDETGKMTGYDLKYPDGGN
ncbi:mammalian cell entry protein [Mycobacterium simiae]|uniref:Mammalian cell entry protein n=1 Tax=Mycobacterium simiae TaxID=1784 RepID=A0A5B1BRZ8_MYCSI|nr:mammalian cell entry protein [Mycobacterium simiae]KAA1250832.1 mammalian cell entry protein [Mycobacterium simiae]